MFNTEKELIEALREAYPSIFSNFAAEIFEEIDLGYGVADLVISFHSLQKSDSLKRKLTLRQRDINIYDLIKQKKEILVDDIIKITRLNKNSVSKSLQVLSDESFINTNKSLVFLNKQYQYPFKRNIAIEAKLKNWRRGFGQAYRYKWFAEYSYLLMDNSNVSAPLKRISLFKRHNVGLASINNNGTLLKHFDPSREAPYDSKMRMLLAEKMFYSFNAEK